MSEKYNYNIGDLVYHPAVKNGEGEYLAEIIKYGHEENQIAYGYKHVFQKYEQSHLAQIANFYFVGEASMIKIDNDEIRRKVINFVLGKE
jgi:hypothetical protein